MVQRSGEEVDSRRPQKKEFPEGWKTEGPFRPQDLRPTTQGVRQHIQEPRNELGHQINLVHLAKTQDRLRHRVEKRGMSASLVPQISQSGGVVRKQADRPMAEKGKEPLKPVKDRKELR